jgi:transcription initiation factor IIE alpha subunit
MFIDNQILFKEVSMGKKSLFRSTSKKKKKTGLGVPKPKSVAKSEKKAVATTEAEKKITAKAVNHANRPQTDLSEKVTAVKSEDRLTATETSTSVKSSTDNGTEKIFDDIKKNTTAADTSKAAVSTYLTDTVITNKNNDPPQCVPDMPESPKVVVNYESEIEMETSTAAKKGIIISVAALLLIYALIISASLINRRNYYVKITPTAVEVRQGCFAPLGVEKEPLITIQDVQPPSPIKNVYTRTEIFNFIFDHYLKAADAVIEQPGIPDVKKVATFLKLAKEYADNDLNRKAANSRINGLKQLFLFYKADIAMFKGTASDLQIAAEYLEKAMLLATDKNQKERIQRQLEAVQRLTAELEQPRGSVTENKKTPTEEAKPADQSSEKAEKDLAPVKSDTAEEKKASTDSTVVKEEKPAAQESKSDKQAVDAKTDAATEK